MTLATETIKLWRNNAGITAGETAEDDPEHIAAKAILALTAELLANREAQPVAYMYKDNIHADARFSLYKRFGNWSQEDINEYEITEIPLYTAPPAPAVPDKPRLPPHVYRDLLDMLQETAIAYGGTQQLRAQLSSALSIHVQPDHPHTRAAMLKGERP
ncbi:hypothetical protein [Serratia ureilytica]|uniref:hypothetical protein n=1 Tax=Serratia ureilytica TaxID=300181 RepID=UPI00191ED8CC|nr:hypothetical protein [Serratia ureilytica]MBL0881240.1 hypothetical protein [Serratia ureilytica]MDN2473506.1 hypothetical protein [Serratia ureilytica]